MTSLFFLYIFVIQLFCSSGVTAFTTPTSSSSSCQRPNGLGTHHRVVTRFHSSNDNEINDVDDGVFSFAHGDGQSDDGNPVDRHVTLIERAQIISYRTAMSACALCLCIQATDDIGFLEGTGANIDQIVEQSSNTLPILAGLTLSLCPVPRSIIFQIGRTSLGLAAIGSGFILNIGNTELTGGDTSWMLSILALIVVSTREIYYFGIEYKQECILTSLTFALMLDHNNHVPFTFPLCALGMSILSAGKLFEPCNEDLLPSNSEFLAK